MAKRAYLERAVCGARGEPLVADVHGDTAHPAEMAGDHAGQLPGSVPLGNRHLLVARAEDNRGGVLGMRGRRRPHVMHLLVRLGGLVGYNARTGGPVCYKLKFKLLLTLLFFKSLYGEINRRFVRF